MLGFVAIVHVNLKKKIKILIEGKESPTRHSFTLHGVGLGTVSHCVESDLAQCYPFLDFPNINGKGIFIDLFSMYS